jgi:integrase/recombinase XerD
MKKIDMPWPGHLGSLMQKHYEFRKAIGRAGTADAYTLYEFNNFLLEHYPKSKTLNRIEILHYLKTKFKRTTGTRRNIVIYIRQFCLFLNQRGINCYIPDKTLAPKYTYQLRYFALTEKHIQILMQMIREHRFNRPSVKEMYVTILGLLWCTGMRIGEVSRLVHDNIDFDKKLIFINQSKFYKDRIIPIDKSVAKALKKYVEIKRKYNFKIGKNDPFFMTYKETAVPPHSFRTMLKRMTKRLGLIDGNGNSPVVHDFRHNFATQWIHDFYKNPDIYPPQSWMPKLSTYLGHTDLFGTQYYLHPNFDLLEKASESFIWDGKNEK